MAVTMADITKLRNLTSAGLMDCKKALAETDGDIEKAVEILRKKGQAVAAKREDREASEGCVLAKCDGTFAAVVALKCETDFVGKNEGFVNLTKSILDAAMAAKAKSLDEVKELEINGQKIADLIIEQTGKTGEKIELGAYECVEAPATVAYNHFGNKLATLVAFSKAGINEQVYKNVAMQVAAMNPLAVDECDVAEEVKEKEIAVAIEKTKAEQVQKAVDAALKKAGINPAHVDSEDHMESNKAKGWITEEDVAKAKEIIATVSAEKAANLPEAMIQNIAKGRLGKFLKEVCLLNQEDVTSDDKKSVRETLKAIDPELSVVTFKRINLNAD
ncbi:MAG: elongation factor Ts [Muribaculaceae bacterium]|nr:elongation factor Ts [Muribaculaceae bacterium]